MLYSSWLKHVAVVDIVTVAAGFVLRAAAGAVAVDVRMSNWFVLVTVFGSLFIVTGKRYAELREIGEDAAAVRATLADYTVGYLRIVLTVSCGAALVSYCQWAFETADVAQADWPFYELSIVPMLTALLRYALVLEQGRGAAPEEVFASDRVLQLLGVVLGRRVRAGGVRPMSGSMRGVDAVLALTAGIDGWMSDDQGRRLYAAAARCRPGGRIVEIGSFRGRSTIVLASAAPDGVEVVAIDPHAGNDRGPQEIDGLRRRGGDGPGRVRGQPGARPAWPTGCATSPASPTSPTPPSPTRSTCCTSTAPTATARPGPTSATGAAASPTAGRC